MSRKITLGQRKLDTLRGPAREVHPDSLDQHEKSRSKRHQATHSPLYPFELDGDGMYQHVKEEDGKVKRVRIASRIEIDAILQDIDTQDVTTILRYWYLGRTLERKVRRGALLTRSIFELADHGVDITERNWKLVTECLHKQEMAMQVTLTHSRIGFGVWEGVPIYKLHKSIGCDSTYSGPIHMEPSGTYEGWSSLIRQQVLGNTPLELALTLGFAAPIASLLGPETDMGTLVFHIFGDSSKGKSTAAMLAVSPFGSPSTSRDGLLKTWNGTENAIIAHLRHNHGVPMAFDEASMHDGDFTKLIYMFANGKEKKRLDQKSKFMEPGQWSGVILSTAEHSLKDKSKQNIGIQMRLLESGNITWTRSAENAEALKAGLLKNFGQAGPRFMEHLMGLNKEMLSNIWGECKRSVLDEMGPSDKFASRLAEKVSIFILAAKLANESLGLDLNVEGIQSMLIKLVAESESDRDIGAKAADSFREHLLRHRPKFHGDSTESKLSENYGRVSLDGTGKINEVYILTDVFKAWMSESGFDDVRVILQSWRDRGWLVCSGNHFTMKKTINGVQTRVYVVQLPKLEIPTEVPERRLPKVRKLYPDNGGERQMDLDFD